MYYNNRLNMAIGGITLIQKLALATWKLSTFNWC